MKNERVLAAVRLSVLRSGTQTGVDKQDKATEDYVKNRGLVLIDTAEDTNVSGGSNPFGIKPNGEYERPGLGPWLLEQEKIAQYDTIVAAKLDRLARSTKYFAQLIEWAKANGKRIVCLDVGGDSVDFAGPIGELIGFIISWLAQQELELIGGRMGDTRRHLRDEGKWDGRPPIYGHRPICLCHGKPASECKDERTDNCIIVLDEYKTDIAREVARRIIDGETMTAIADDLSARGVPSPGKAEQWNDTSIGRIMRNPAVMGYVTYRPIIGKKENGKAKYAERPVIRVDTKTGMGNKPNPEIIDPDTYDAVQAALAARASKKRGTRNRKDSPMLSGVITDPCGIPFYQGYYGRNGESRTYSRNNYKTDPALLAACTHSGGVQADKAELAVTQWINEHDFEIHERRLISRDERDRELTDAYEQFGRLGVELARGNITYEELTDYQAKLNERITSLTDAPIGPAVFESVPTGRTMAREWASWNDSQRNRWLKDKGFRVIAWQEPMQFAKGRRGGISGKLHVEVIPGEEWNK